LTVSKALPSTFGICRFSGSDLVVNMSVDLAATPACSFCSDLYDSVVLNVKYCEEAECDGLLCFKDSKYYASASFRPPTDRCVKDNILEDNCNDCDSECLTMCDKSESFWEEDLVTCAYDLSLIGTTDCCPHGLCTGSVPSQFCDNAVADNRTCFIASIERGTESFPTEKCAPVFASVYKYIGEIIDYWACPMDVTVTMFGESIKIYQKSPEYCTDTKCTYLKQ
jgi:hypothetical protein